MAKFSKKYKAALSKINVQQMYKLRDALQLVKETSATKFDSSVDMAINLGVDPRQAEQNIRGAVALPHGLGKKVRIVVFAKGDKAIEATNAGAEAVGTDDLAKKIQDGWLEFDQVIATPDMMVQVGKLGKVLGPRGLMPNPKLGTVTFDVTKVIKELKAGRAEYKLDKAGIVHTTVGKVSLSVDQLEENAKTVIDVLIKSKPSTAKGTYLKKMTVSSTMGPGVKIDTLEYKV